MTTDNNLLLKKTSLASAIATSMFSTLMVVAPFNYTHASDIDIYQQARDGTVSLMFMVDISGSMSRYARDSNVSLYGGFACDLPSGVSEKSRSKNASGSSLTDTSAPKYLRQWCIGKDGINYYDRITRVKDGMIELLYGNKAANIDRLNDSLVLGLSTLGYYSGSAYKNTGAVLIPARRLDAVVATDDGSSTQRQLLIDAIGKLNGETNTPTARSYAETGAYLLGTTTKIKGVDVTRMPYYRFYGEYSTGKRPTYSENWQQCSSWDTNYTGCTKWNTLNRAPTVTGFSNESCFFNPNQNTNDGYGGGLKTGSCYYYYGELTVSDDTASGFGYSASSTKNDGLTKYELMGSLKDQIQALKEDPTITQCSGQGVYVLTDGEPTPNYDTDSDILMKNSLAVKADAFSCDGTGSWDCIHKYATALLQPESNPVNLKFKTAVVGFGNEFNGINSYSATLSKAENLALIESTGKATNADTNVINAAKWGVIGEGGWYSGSSSLDVVNSIRGFINTLSTEIPSVTTGTPSIAQDALNSLEIQPFAYYPQFQPQPETNYQVWYGNLKKYNSLNGYITDKLKNSIVDAKGRLVDNYDLWSFDVNPKLIDADATIVGSKANALLGGAKMKLDLGFIKKFITNEDGTLTEDPKVYERKILTNRMSGSNGFYSSNNGLRLIKTTDLSDEKYKTDPYKGYLMALLGFKVNPTNSDLAEKDLKDVPEIRQFGGVMHSTPVLLTQKGVIAIDGKNVVSKKREDYILFGTSQGLLHVLDAESGKEVFSFLPNEMVEKQHKAFVSNSTTEGITNLWYGIDGPWTTHTEYVIEENGDGLTVGAGKSESSGKQWAYGGLRMGGKSYYALDLSDIKNPKLKFHIDPDNSSLKPIKKMGESWSKPELVQVNWKGKKKLVMIVGGGYDRAYESDNNNPSDSSAGNGLYMFDADNGDLLMWVSSDADADTSGNPKFEADVLNAKHPDMKYSVVSKIKAIDRDSDGLVDHLYFGDLGGQIFRVDLNNAKADEGFVHAVTKIFSANSGASSPRFFETPTFTTYEGSDGIVAVISIGSGNRSKPMAEYNETTTPYKYDGVYNIYDKDVARRDLYSPRAVYSTKNVLSTDLVEIKDADRSLAANQDSYTYKAPFNKKGWMHRFISKHVQSEKVMGDLVAINFDLYVSTFDASKDGLAGNCGAGVKGETQIERFCLPFGQCTDGTTNAQNNLNIGAGILGVSIASGRDENNASRSVLLNPKASCTGDDCKSDNYIESAVYPTKAQLVPLRWYQRLTSNH